MKLTSTLLGSGNTNDGMFCDQEVTFTLAASNLRSVFETLYATRLLSALFFRSYHISCLPNAFLENEVISSEKNNKVHFSTTYILCIENKLKTRPTDIKLLITITNYRYNNYQCTFCSEGWNREILYLPCHFGELQQDKRITFIFNSIFLRCMCQKRFVHWRKLVFTFPTCYPKELL